MPAIQRWSKSFLELLRAPFRGLVQKTPSTSIPVPNSDWRQGSVLPKHLCNSAKGSFKLFPPLEPEALVIIISQDCDILHHSYEGEPYVETLIARPLPGNQRNGNHFHGKNPRQLQFALQTDTSTQLYSVNIHEKSRIDRKLLLEGLPEPSIQLDSVIIELLVRWTAKRYTRAAFPNEFNERCRPAANRIRDRLQSKGELITAIFLELNSYEELELTQTYEVTIYATARRETCENEREEEIAIALVAMLEKQLNSCDGVEVKEADLRSEEDISLSDLRHLRRWDYDSLSYRDNDIQGMAPYE